MAATVGAILYTTNGYFVSHFSQGHATFPFYCFIPVLIYLFERAHDDGILGRPTTKTLCAIGIASWVLFTAGLPHPLFYFYPAFLLLVVVKIWLSHRHHGKVALRSSVFPLLAHGLGILIAFYKLWPIVAFQASSPRQGVMPEVNPLFVIIGQMFDFATHYEKMGQPFFKGQFWGGWEYNWFMGPFVLLLPIMVLVHKWMAPKAGASSGKEKLTGKAAKRLKKKQQNESGSGDEKSSSPAFRTPDGKFAIAPQNQAIFPDSSWVVGYSLLLIFLGLWLSLGNEHPFSIAGLFKYFPLLNGIRVWSRYSILCVFGFVILASFSLSYLDQRFGKRRWFWPIAILLVVGPAVSQTLIMGYNLTAIPRETLAKAYPLPVQDRIPMVGKQIDFMKMGGTTQTYLLEQGYWVGNCYEALSVNPLDWNHPVASLPLASPGTIQDVILGPSSLKVQLDPASLTGADIVLNVPMSADIRFEPAPKTTSSVVPTFPAAAVKERGGTIEITADTSAVKVGTGISFAGLVGFAAMLFISRRKETKAK